MAAHPSLAASETCGCSVSMCYCMNCIFSCWSAGRDMYVNYRVHLKCLAGTHTLEMPKSRLACSPAQHSPQETPRNTHAVRTLRQRAAQVGDGDNTTVRPPTPSFSPAVCLHLRDTAPAACKVEGAVPRARPHYLPRSARLRPVAYTQETCGGRQLSLTALVPLSATAIGWALAAGCFHAA